MQVRVAVDALDAGHAGVVAELVGIGRVDDEGGLADLDGERVGELAAELRGVLDAVGAAVGMVEQDVVHLVGTAHHGEQAAAASNERVDGVERDAVLLEDLEDQVAAVGHLVGDALELGELGRLVGDVLGEHLGLTIEHAYLGGGRARVDYHDAIGLVCHCYASLRA